ncbi:unnamed protein product [Durusdinium trenchii]|uniref:Uncharacterized protein n=1 Tax=Durusdinium trenchii TaxID=1381693 RepID=A0ABP0QPR7_9DINO
MRSLTNSLHHVVALSLLPSSLSIICDGESHLHIASFTSELATSMGAFFASTMRMLGRVTLLDDGKGATWPPYKRLLIYRDYLRRLPDLSICDWVLLIDSYDTVIMEGEEGILEILHRLEQQTGVSSFFGAEALCQTECRAQEQAAAQRHVDTPWKYLNAGLHAGRLWAMRRIFEEPINVSTAWTDQDWAINLTLAKPDLAVLDYRQELFMNAFSIQGLQPELPELARSFGQPAGALAVGADPAAPSSHWIENRITQTRPPIVHFPGNAKFPALGACTERPEHLCQQSLPFEVVRLLLPSAWKGWKLNEMQDLLDDFSQFSLFRKPMSPYHFQYQALWEVVQQLKDRDHVLSYLIAGHVLVLLAAVSYCGWMRCSSRSCTVQRCSVCAPKKGVHAV